MRTSGLIILCFIVSCGVIRPGQQKKFSFYKDNRPSWLHLQIPKGALNEQVRVGNTGKEQFYTYDNGARLFVGLNLEWPTMNEQLRLFSATDRAQKNRKGVDSNGKHWKEIYVDNFTFGYTLVENHQLESFDRALNTIRFR